MAHAEALSRAISEALGRPFQAESSHPVAGGNIDRALVLEGAGERFFVKLNTADALPRFEAEGDGLLALGEAGGFRVPQPLSCGVIDDEAWLVLEYLELEKLASREVAIHFARALAGLHRNCGAQYGWRRDNFIGASPQSNAQDARWPQFFAQQRLAPQFRRAQVTHPQLAQRGEALLEKLPALFVDHRPPASLLHGDLWHGNAAWCAHQPALFDPAVYCGDRETDLAMTELFGGFPEAFHAAYREAWPLADGHETRRVLYQLYHVLNHLNLFGRGYLGEAERMVARLLAELRG